MAERTFGKRSASARFHTQRTPSVRSASFEWLWVLVVFVACAGGLYWFYLYEMQRPEQIAAQAEQSAEEARQAERGRKEALARRELEQKLKAPPEPQKRFLKVVQESAREFQSAKTELAQGATRPKRGANLCAVVGYSADDWIGTIQDLSTNSDGKGVLRIRLDRGISVSTWNNAFSDIGDKTLIDPQSQLYKGLLAHNLGTLVRFSGTFFRSDVDCIKELSVTLAGSIQDPAFIMRFSRVTPISK